jgi:hypothetical protein
MDRVSNPFSFFPLFSGYFSGLIFELKFILLRFSP